MKILIYAIIMIRARWLIKAEQVKISIPSMNATHVNRNLKVKTHYEKAPCSSAIGSTSFIT